MTMRGGSRRAGGGTHRRARRSGPLFVLAAATLWGTTGTARALGAEDASPYAVGAVRLGVGGMLLLAAAGRRGLRSRVRDWPRLPLALAVTGVAAYQPLFFGGVSRAGVAVGTVVGIGTSPIVGGILGRLARHERLGGHWVVATLLGIAGAALLARGGDTGEDVALGLVLAVGAGVAYAVYVAASAELLDHVDADDATAVVLGAGGLVLVPVAVVAGLGWLREAQGAATAAWLAVVTVAIAYPLLARGLDAVGVGATATLTLAEPATAALLGLLVLDERLTGSGWLGLLLVAAGVGVEASRARDRPPEAPP